MRWYRDLVWKIVFFNEAIPSLPSIFRIDVEKMPFKEIYGAYAP